MLLSKQRERSRMNVFSRIGVWLPFDIHDFVLIPQGARHEVRIDGEGTVYVKITPLVPVREIKLKFELDYGGGVSRHPTGYKMHEDS